MLLLTATAETQGQKPGDFCDTIEGELVVIFADCHVHAHQDDLLRCREGCPPRFFGLNSHEGTTTALVRDVAVSPEDFLVALSGYAERRGSGAPRATACVLGTRMVNCAVVFLPGTVVGFTEGKLTARTSSRHGWRDVVTAASCMVRAFAWRRYYDEAIRAIERAESLGGPQ
jgi:hypothetical protein